MTLFFNIYESLLAEEIPQESQAVRLTLLGMKLGTAYIRDFGRGQELLAVSAHTDVRPV